MDFYISATTDIGIKRTVNQDSLTVRKLATRTGPMVLAVLCDGMGGLRFGEMASASLIGAFTDWMYTYLPVLSQKPLEDHVIREQWTDIIIAENEKIRHFGREHNCNVGSTVTALLLTENRYFLLNIGDSRAYEVSDRARQLTEDHTLAADEVRRGNMTREQADQAPMQNVLTRCVGVMEEVQPDMFFGDTKKDALYILCSDGFRHHISMEEIREHFKKCFGGEEQEIKQQEEYLVELNKQRGETDNISVVTVMVR